MNRREFYQRISGIVDPEQLRSKTVVVVGLGSGGARVAAELGRLGIGLVLVDRPGERLEEHNIVRHLLGYRSLGKLKLRETVRYIAQLNPSAALSTKPLDVVEKKHGFAQLLATCHPDLIAVCTDNEQSKHAINQAALAPRIPQVGAGVYDGGIGGEIYKVLPGDACYGCIADFLQLARFSPSKTTPSNYTSGESEKPEPVSALNLDIEQIALLQCRVILDVLLKRTLQLTGLPSEINLCTFANRLVPGTFPRPWHAEFFEVPRRQDCLDCSASPQNVEADAARILAGLGRKKQTALLPS